jgi:hypothetical protein
LLCMATLSSFQMPPLDLCSIFNLTMNRKFGE